MFENSKKITISKHFLISLLFVILIFTSVGVSIDNVCASELNQSVDGIESELNIEDKLGNSQENMLNTNLEEENTLNVAQDSEILGQDLLHGGTFSDIREAIGNARTGEVIKLAGTFKAEKAYDQIVLNKRVTITSDSSATLDGCGLTLIFLVNSTAPYSVIENLKIINGYHKGTSAGIYVNAHDVTISNCEFENNDGHHGGAISTPNDNYTSRNLLIQNCKFIRNHAVTHAGAIAAMGDNSRIIKCTFDSNYAYDRSGLRIALGGAIQVGMDNYRSRAYVHDCKFLNNWVKVTHVEAHGGAGCVRDGVEYKNCVFINNSAAQGGALTMHASGSIKNCTFINNSAFYYGGAISTGYANMNMDLTIQDCNFNGNEAPIGGAVQLIGMNIDINDCKFNNNNASQTGGAVNVNAETVTVKDSSFNENTAHVDGGAIFINGKNTQIKGSSFISNDAIPDMDKLDDGLGGAIYINSTEASISNNKFYYNTARNGSAIYYDKYGSKLNLTNNTLFENQAWVYALPIFAHDIYYGQTENISSVIHGGNNIGKYNDLSISNAIYNAASNINIEIDGQNPQLGATTSGHLYQDDREYNMDILLTVVHEDGSVVYNKTLNSNCFGEVKDSLANLKVGKYYVSAKHYEDTYYKGITNSTTFKVTAQVDDKIRKSVSSENIEYKDIVVWTLNITNNGPSNATNLVIRDVLPDGLVYIDDDTNGAYNPKTGSLTIDSLKVGEIYIVNIKTWVNKTGEITNNANVTAHEHDYNLTNNHDESKINVNSACDLAIKKVANVSVVNLTSLVEWTLTVKNNGPDTATGVVVRDVLPKSLIWDSDDSLGKYNHNSGEWTIGTLNKGASVSLKIVTRVNQTGTIKNEASVSGQQYDYDETNNYDSAIVNVNPACDLGIVKTVSPGVVNYTDVVKWTLTVTNYGPDDATGVKIYDTLPNGFSIVSSTKPYSNGVITIGDLAKGASVCVDIFTRADITGTFVNVANVKGNEFDYNLTNNKDDASIFVKPATDLAVKKMVNNSQPNFNDEVEWTLTVTNNGPDAATGVVVSDLLPKSLIWVSDSGLGKYNRVTGVWDIGSLSKGSSVSLKIVTRVNQTGTIKNDVSVFGNEFDFNKSNNKDSKSIFVNPACDLGIVKTVSPGVVNYTDVVKWTLTVTNYGPDDATGVKIYDTLPNGFVVVSSTKPYSNGIIDIGSLAKGASVCVDIFTRADITGSFVNVARVNGSEYDYNLVNNKDDASIFVKPATDLVVIKKANATTFNLYDEVEWTLTVTNNGPDAATGVVVSDLLPKSLIWVSDSGLGKYNRVTGVWDIGSLSKGSSVSLKIVTRVNQTGTIKNDVSVTGNEFDFNKSNNKDSKSIFVNPACDLGIVKTVSPGVVNYTDVVKWTLTVTNYGPDDATGVKIYDILPNGFSIVSSTKPYSNGVITIGDLAKGASVSVDIFTRADITGSFVNVARVNGTEYDYNLVNNKDDASIFVKPATDLVVIKKANATTFNLYDEVEWTLTVTNNGPDDATGVNVKDVLPKSLIWVSDSGLGKYNRVTGVWDIGSLSKGSSVSLKIVTGVNQTGTIKNDVSVSGNEFDFNKSNNKDSKCIFVNPACDLGIVKTVSQGVVNYTDVVKWTLTVTNYGPDDATGVKIYDTLPNGFSIVSSTKPYSNGVIDIGSLAKGASVSVDIFTRADITGTFVNVARVNGSEFDYNLANNKANVSIFVKPACDLIVDKTVNNPKPNFNDSIIWTIKVTNNGPDTATGVNVKDVLPDSLIWISDNSQGKYNRVTGIWDIGDIGVGKTKVLTITTRINGTGEFTNNVSVSGKEFDYNKTNNKDNETIKVANASDLSVIKLTNASTVNYLQLIKWTIIAKNNGPDKATGVYVDEILPNGLKLLNYTATKGFYDNNIWNVCCLEKGETQSLELICQVTKTGKLTNVVRINGSEYDPDKSNNEANKTILVPISSDLAVIKTVDNSYPDYGDIVQWNITVINNGPDDAHDVFVFDLMPKGLELLRYTASVGNYYDDTWIIDNLKTGASETLILRCLVKTLEDVENIVEVVPSEYDWNESNNNDSEKISVNPIADLEVIKLVNNSSPNYMDLVKWTLIVTNHGPNDATGVFVCDNIPSGLKIMSALGDGDYDGSFWDVGNLVIGEYKQLEIVCQVQATGEFTNTAIVWADQDDPVLENNQDQKDIYVKLASDISITKTVSKYRYSLGDLVKYSIKVTNNGPDDAENVEVREIMDENLRLKSFHASAGEFDKVNDVWSLNLLEVGESAYLKINAEAQNVGAAKNKVVATSDNYDPDLSNNNDTVTVNISKSNKPNDGVKKEYKKHPNEQFRKYSKSILEKYATANPFMVIVLLFVFTMGAIYGKNILKKR